MTKKIEILCNRCNEIHKYEVRQEHVDSGLTFNFGCLNIKRLPRITSLRIDFTKNLPQLSDEDKTRVSGLFGIYDVDNKIIRKNQINKPKLWLIHDFDQYFEEIISAYIIGSYYPVATSCTTLAERLINLFISKMRDMYDRSLLNAPLQKYVYTRDQNWQSFESNIKVISAWKLLSLDQKKWFNELLSIRNRAVHYQSSFDPQSDSLSAVNTLHKIIDSYFSPFERKDVIRLFEIPGEIWVREDKLSDPFVKAFILPCCNYHASCGTLNKDKKYHENDAIVGIFSEDDFIKQRKKYNLKSSSGHKPTYKKIKIENQEITYRII